MAFINAIQICRTHQNFKVLIDRIMYSHKHRKYVIDNRRNFASFTGKPSDQKGADERPNSCPNKCGKKKKGSFWDGMFGGKKKSAEKQRPPIETCQLRQARGENKDNRDDPDLSQFGGQPYKTCGSAYVIQKERAPEMENRCTKEDEILKKIEAPPSIKDYVDDPMPPYETVEQRLIDLSQRKLHPFYKRYQSIGKKLPLEKPPKHVYKSRSGPICVDDIPVQLKYNKELMEKKNMYSEYKRVQPPQDLVAKLIELQNNERPTLEKRMTYQTLERDRKPPKRKAVYETLNKNETGDKQKETSLTICGSDS